ncbi:unnamed protein product [Closterium sp. NIES-54]
MYAVSTSDEGDCYLCLPPDPGIEAAALGACEAAALGASASAAPGASESALSGTASAQVFHTFTLDSGASRSFFRDRTTLTPLSRLVAVSLVDPSGGPVLASFSTVLPCPAAPSGTLSGLYLPSFSTNLVSGADVQDQGVDQFTPASQRVTHCTCARTGRHLATFTHRPGSSLYTLSTESPPVTVSGQAAALSQVFAAASRSGMASRVLVFGLPRSLPPLPPGPAPTCVPCVEGRQRAAPHSSEFPPTEAPLQTLHMEAWGPARVRGQGHERYFLLVVDDYSRYTTVFPLRSKGDVTEVLIDWIRAARLQLRESFGSDLPVLRLHSDRGGEFSSARLGAFCRAQGIRQTFTLPASPQQNGIAERHIGMVMDVARTSMIHAAAPHFLWPFAVQYAAHQLNLQPRVSLPDTSPTLRWTGKVGDASAFWVWGSRAFVRDLSADKLSPCVVPCVFLGFPPDAHVWQFYHPTSRRVLSSQDVTFDKSVPYYRLFPYRTAPLPPPPLFLAPGPPPVDPLPPQGPAPSGVSQVDAVEPVEVAVDSGAARGAEPVGAGSGGAESVGAEHGGAEPGGAESGVRAAGAGGPPVAPGPGGARTGGTGAVGTGGAAAAAGVGPAGAFGAADAGATGGVGAGVGAAGASRAAGAGASGGVGAGVGAAVASGAAGAGAAGGVGAGVGPAGVGALGAGGAAGTGAATGGTSAVPVGTGDPARPRPYFVPPLEQVLGLPPSPDPAPPLECPQPIQSQSSSQPVSPLPAPSPYAGPTGGLAERREPASRPASPVRATRSSRRASRPRPPAVPGTHQMTLRPSTAPLRVPLTSPPESSVPVLADPAADSLRAASPTAARLMSNVVTDPSFESTAASALVAELVDFAARCRLDYAASLVAESASVCPPSVGDECALSTDVLEDTQEEFQCFAAALPHLVSTLIALEGDMDAPDIPTPRSYAEAIEGPYSSQWQSAMDAEMASWKSTGTYIDEVPPPGANIVSGMWILRVKRPPGSRPIFKARYVARGFSQRQGVDYFHTFSPNLKMTTLRVLLHVAAQRDYELHSLDFSTAFLQGSLHEEILLRRPPGFTGSFPPGTQWSLRRPVYGLRQAPCKWHDTLRTTLAALGFAPSTADPSLFLRTDTSLSLFYILVYVDDLVFATADTAGLAHVKSELQKRHTCTDLGELRSYLGLQITRDRAQRTITLTQSQVLQGFDFTYSSPQATPLSTRHSLSALPSDESVEPSGPYPELVGCLMYLMTCTRPDLAYPLSILARYVAPGRHRLEHMAAAKRVLRYLCSTSGLGLVLGGRRPVVLTGHADASWADDQAKQRSSQGNTFSLGSGSVSWQSTRSSSVLGSSCEAEIYAGAMVAQELRWLTYLLTDLGEPPRSPPVLYVDNKAMLAFCREHRLEHKTKHIGLRYFHARELQQRGQLCLAYVASEANTADIFTKALPPGDHQRFCTMLGFPTCTQLILLVHHSSFFHMVVEVVAAVGVVEAAVVEVGVELFRREVVAVAKGSSSSSVGVRPLRPSSFTCENLHSQHRCLSRLDDAWRAEFGDKDERPCWLELLRSGVDIFALDYDAILAAMYALTVSAEGDCYLCVPPDPGIEAAALGASESTLPGTAPAEALHTFTLDSDASRCFFHSLHLFQSDSLTTQGAQFLHVPPLFSRVRRSLPPLPPSPAPPCLPCVEGRQRAAPHSSSFRPTIAPLQTLHMDVWGPARVSRRDREHYLLVVDDYTCYTMVFPLCSKGEVPDGLIPWIRAVRLQLRERFREDLPVLRLHSDRGVMEVARTSMIHAAAPHFPWPFAVRYAAHQLNLWPHVSLPETSPTIRWTGKVGDASVFRVWGSRAFVRDPSADKLSSLAIPYVFLGFPPDVPGWQFYHPISRRFLPSQDVTFDESVPFYRLFPYRTSPLPPPRRSSSLQVPLRGAASGGADPASAEPGGAEPEGAKLGGVESEGAESRGSELEGPEPRGTEPEGAELGGAESEGAECVGAEPRGTASAGGPVGASP